jgi:hypothetical protein
VAKPFFVDQRIIGDVAVAVVGQPGSMCGQLSS